MTLRIAKSDRSTNTCMAEIIALATEGKWRTRQHETTAEPERPVGHSVKIIPMLADRISNQLFRQQSLPFDHTPVRQPAIEPRNGPRITVTVG